MSISKKELELFSRHLILKEFNEKNFNFIQKQRITLVGVGGIGCPIAQYLVATGIKNLKIIDSDKVELSNLNRQTLFDQNDVNKKKAFIASRRLKKINKNINIEGISEKVTNKNITKLLSNSSLIIDTTDNWKSMFLINKFCVKNFIPLLSCSILGLDGQAILFKNSKDGHMCLNCIYPNPDDPNLPRCETVGILGTTAGITGLIGVQLIINFLTNNQVNTEKIIMINTKSLKIDYIKIKKYEKYIFK